MATVQKGYIENLVNGVKYSFQYNPEEIGDKQSITFAQIKSPGISYPRYQFVSGEAREINFDLFVDGMEHTNGVQTWLTFFAGIMPWTNSNNQFSAPCPILFAFGTMVRKCLIQSIDTKYTMFDANLNPIRATFTLSLLVIQ
jgi:hypothetical protein